MTTGLQVPNEKPPQTAWVWAAGEREERRGEGRGGGKNAVWIGTR